MFDTDGLPGLSAVAGMDDAGLIDVMAGSGRLESAVLARRLIAVGELYLRRRRERVEAGRWVIDPWEEVAAELSAAQGIGRSRAHHQIRVGVALRRDLPQVAAVFATGTIDFRMVATIVRRTELVDDAQILAKIDVVLARRTPRWMKLSGPKLADCIDSWVARFDPAGVHQQPEAEPTRYVEIAPTAAGMAGVWAQVHATDAAALDQRLDQLAATVCADDPRTKEQRRADALGALAAGDAALWCGCGSRQCPGTAIKTGLKVVIHVLAEQSTVTRAGSGPALLAGFGMLPAPLLRDVAASAALRPLVIPEPGLGEPGYRPSAGLAQFVRWRDLTCRFPGCDAPAAVCDIDHTIADAIGGPTAASNLKLLCRKHHLLKTFCAGWSDRQLPDGTVIWTAPTGHAYPTYPAGALLFPALGQSTGPVRLSPRMQPISGDPTVMMPLRQRTRDQDLRYRISRQRRDNRARLDELKRLEEARLIANDEPPPF
jgi:hypothetical protein